MSLCSRLAALGGAAVLTTAQVASAHVSAAGPLIVGSGRIVNFGVGHGCAGADTYRVEIELPEQVTSTRALPSAWGEAELTRNDEGIVTKVTWEKSSARDSDDQYYQFALRITVPDVPFTKLYFPATQYCRDSEGEESMAAWILLPEESEEEGHGEEMGPAPGVWVLPPRAPGWNKYTVERDIEDLSVFDDAQIVWAGDAAYSANPAIMELIADEDDVEVLESIEADTEIWVKY